MTARCAVEPSEGAVELQIAVAKHDVETRPAAPLDPQGWEPGCKC